MTLDHELEVLVEALHTAGSEALRLAAAGFETKKKPDHSPVTSADLAVNQILASRLRSAFPEDGWLSEESPDTADRLRNLRVWIVDPIDGTKAFISGVPEFCLSVALVERGEPIVAAIFNPSTDELFTAIRGDGLCLNHHTISAGGVSHEQDPIVSLSPWERESRRFAALEAIASSRPMRSIAWALALTASGRIDAVVTMEPENEWDVAAGTLMILESGGSISDGSGQTLTFNREEPRYRGILATSPYCAPALAREVNRLAHGSGDDAQ